MLYLLQINTKEYITQEEVLKGADKKPCLQVLHMQVSQGNEYISTT